MRSYSLALLVALATPLTVWAGPWDLPAEGACSAAAIPGAADEDAVPFPFQPGDVIDHARAERLGGWIPDEIWRERERFFFDGMQLEIGPCFRDYSPPGYYHEAGERFRGVPRLDADGRLREHTAGQPFPSDTIAADDADAGLRWAWNWVKRYRGGGRFGDLRLSWVGRHGVSARFVGEFFWVILHGRADLAASDYRVPFDADPEWVSGGETRNLSNGSTCAWRQYATGERRPDVFFWSPGARRIVRGVSPDSEGPFSGCLSDTASSSMFLHGESPQLHEWRVLGVRDLLAPINARAPAFPEDEDRDFGPWGISFANDRWELRRVLVLEGRLREGRFEDRVQRFVWYLDLQTLAPLYYVGLRDRGESGGVGYFLHRWSEDREDYPHWPDGRSLRVLDEVGSALVDWTGKDSVRTERWNTVAVPPKDKRVRRLISQSSLRGR